MRKKGTLTIGGVAFPRSTRSRKERHSFRYVRSGSDSLNWRGADWEYPTSLDFQISEARSERVAMDVVVGTPYREELDAQEMFFALNDALHSINVLLRTENKVLDTSIQVAALEGRLRFRAVVWPAIPGVTTYADDTTL